MVRLPEKGTDEHAHGEDTAHNSSSLPTLAELSHEVKELVRHISTTDITELHLESGSVRITIKRGTATPLPPSAPVYPPAGAVYTPPAVAVPDAPRVISMIGQSPMHGEGVMLAEGEHLIAAPMVGTFYSASSPGADPYVSEGEAVQPGQTVGIIEAMKMMNPIESEIEGTVVRILVQNAQPVEYGQPLMVVSVNA